MRTPRYDAIVVGSGAGGAAAAYRLTLGGLRVALLEKGGHLPTDGSTLDVRRVIHEGAFLSREAWLDGRGRQFRPQERFNVGGKTKWYGAALVRFAAREFLPDPAHGCLGWPFALSELAPFYEEAERLLAVRTFECERDLSEIVARIRAGAAEWHAQAMPMSLSGKITADRFEAAHFDGFASRRRLKGEAEGSLLSRLQRRDNFSLLVNAEVDALIGASDSPATICGVRLANGETLCAPCVILAAGALHSPRILWRYIAESGLAARLPAAEHVGRHVKLHLLSAVVALSWPHKTDLLRKTVLLRNDSYPHSSAQPLGFDGELISTLVPKWAPRRLAQWIGSRAYGFFLQTEDGSDPRNRVVERGTPGKPPVLDYEESRMPAAHGEHRRFVRAFRGALARAGLVTFTRRVGLEGTAHVCGSLICGAAPSNSVVDRHGRVHGMTGIYVADGSVLPRSSAVNPSLTIYAWGLRLGDFVTRQFRGELQRSPAPADGIDRALQ